MLTNLSTSLYKRLTRCAKEPHDEDGANNTYGVQRAADHEENCDNHGARLCNGIRYSIISFNTSPLTRT